MACQSSDSEPRLKVARQAQFRAEHASQPAVQPEHVALRGGGRNRIVVASCTARQPRSQQVRSGEPVGQADRCCQAGDRLSRGAPTLNNVGVACQVDVLPTNGSLPHVPAAARVLISTLRSSQGPGGWCWSDRVDPVGVVDRLEGWLLRKRARQLGARRAMTTSYCYGTQSASLRRDGSTQVT